MASKWPVGGDRVASEVLLAAMLGVTREDLKDVREIHFGTTQIEVTEMRRGEDGHIMVVGDDVQMVRTTIGVGRAVR